MQTLQFSAKPCVHDIIGNLTSLIRFLLFVSSWTIGVIERTGSDGS